MRRAPAAPPQPRSPAMQSQLRRAATLVVDAHLLAHHMGARTIQARDRAAGWAPAGATPALASPAMFRVAARASGRDHAAWQAGAAAGASGSAAAARPTARAG